MIKSAVGSLLSSVFCLLSSDLRPLSRVIPRTGHDLSVHADASRATVSIAIADTAAP
jgi:hypothetical protein